MQVRADLKRSLAGAAIAVGVFAALLGIAACLKVPVGDPERAQIDPRMNGAWLTDDPDEVWFFRPWDARTWLVVTATVNSSEDACRAKDTTEARKQPDPADVAAAESGSGQEAPARAPGFGSYGNAEAAVCDVRIHKGWLTSLGGHPFLVLEPAAVVPPDPPAQEDYPFSEFYWIVHRIDWSDTGRLQLRIVDENFGGLDEVRSTAEAEKIIAANVDDPALYGDEEDTDDEPPPALRRASAEVDANIQRLLWIFAGYSK